RAETEHVHRHAIGIAAVDDRFAGRHAVDLDDLERLLRLYRVDIVLVIFVEDRHRAQRADVVADPRCDLAAHPALKAIVGVAQVVAARRAALAGHTIANEGIAAGVGARRGAAERPRLLRAQEGIVAVDRI